MKLVISAFNDGVDHLAYPREYKVVLQIDNFVNGTGGIHLADTSLPQSQSLSLTGDSFKSASELVRSVLDTPSAALFADAADSRMPDFSGADTVHAHPAFHMSDLLDSNHFALA